PARRARALGADPDDRGGHRAGFAAIGHRHAPAGAGNRRTHGGDGARRAAQLHLAQPGRAAGACGTLRWTQARGGQTMMRRLLLSCAAAAMLAGCTNTPPPGLKAGDVPTAFEQKPAVIAPIWPAKDWWTNYNDPQLASLMDQAQANNLDIAQAAARLRQADARARQAGA